MTSSKTRTYVNIKGKMKVKTWSQRRCKKCQRYLANKEIIYCKRCSRKEALKSYNNSEKHRICNRAYKRRVKKL